MPNVVSADFFRNRSILNLWHNEEISPLGLVNVGTNENVGTRFCAGHPERWLVLVLIKPKGEISSISDEVRTLRNTVTNMVKSQKSGAPPNPWSSSGELIWRRTFHTATPIQHEKMVRRLLDGIKIVKVWSLDICENLWISRMVQIGSCWKSHKIFYSFACACVPGKQCQCCHHL